MEKLGIAGNIAKAFINSKLTPLIVLAALLLGVYAVLVTPREEEPQIVVPMIDIYLPLPGSTPKEVEERVVVPFEKTMWELPGVEYVYSMSKPGMGLVTVRFLVGEDMEKSLVKLHNKVMEKRTILPPGAGEPLVMPKSIDDVPILTLTLWSGRYDGQTLRKLGRELCEELKKGYNVAETRIVGGLGHQLTVRLDSARLAAYGLSPLQVMGAIQGGNARLPSGAFSTGNREFLVETGSFIADAEDARRLVVSVRDGRPVYLSDVATVVDGPEEPKDYVFFGLGPAADHKGISGNRDESYPAVTLSVAKRKGANATWVAEDLIRRVEFLKGKVIPSDVQVTVTRN